MAEKKYEQLREQERYEIAALRKAGMGTVEIAGKLGRHRTTIWRERKRNGYPSDGSYRPLHAESMSRGRRRRSRRVSQYTEQVKAEVKGLLGKQWSPEQVSGI